MKSLLAFMVLVQSVLPLQRQESGHRPPDETITFTEDVQHVCSIYIYTDPFLWRQVHSIEGRNATATYDRIRAMIKRSVREANRVYNMAEFYGKGRTIHRGIKFELTDFFIDTDLNCGPRKIQTPWNFHETDCLEPNVPMVDICAFEPKCRIKSSVFCNDIRSMRFFLHAFSAMRHDKHCLAFAFTYREMSDFQGIAWIKGHNPNESSTMDYFGYCANDDAKRCRHEGHHWPEYYYRNTGVVNLHLIRGVLSEKSATHIFIHELGHSLGARHDDESEECINLTDEIFLMTGEAKKIVLGQTSQHFSTCSSLKIGLNLDESTCWLHRRGANKMCNRKRSLKAHRNCLDELPKEELDLLATGVYTSLAAIMLILSISACIFGMARKCKKPSIAKSASSSSAVFKNRDTRLVRSTQNGQNGNTVGYAQIAKNDWLIVENGSLDDDGHNVL